MKCNPFSAPGSISGWPQKATLDPKTITQWWTRWPAANIGYITGEKTWITDQDNRAGGNDSLYALESEHGALPETVDLTTGDGQHFHFKIPPGRKVRNGFCFAPGLETKALGGYSILPPSVHPSGKIYTWDHDPGLVEPAEPPGWLLDLVCENGKREPIGQQLNAGERYPALRRAAGTLRNMGLSAVEMLPALIALDRQRSKPPRGEKICKALAEDFEKRYPPGKAPLSERGTSIEDVPSLPERSQIAFFAEQIERPEWIIEGLIHTGVNVLAAREKGFKTFFALGCAQAVAEGGIALGCKHCKKSAVLYLALDDHPGEIQERQKDKMQVTPQPNLFIIKLDDGMRRIDQGGIQQLEDWMQRHPETGLIIVDLWQSVKRVKRARDDSYEEGYESLKPLKEFAIKHRIAILVLHHLRKTDSEDPHDLISGSTGFLGCADNLLVMYGSRKAEQRRLWVSGKRIRIEYAAQFTLNEAGHIPITILGDAEIFEMEPERLEVAELLDRHPAGLHTREIVDALKKHPSTMRVLLRRMVKAGVIKNPRRGFYAREKRNMVNNGNIHNN